MNTSFEPISQAPTQRAAHRESQSAKAYPSRTIVHAKLEMTEPGDHDEREADAIANTVMSGGKIARKISSGGSGSSGIAVSSQMESQLNHLQGGGQAMPEGLRSMMESGFVQDFGQVRLHTDGEAATMSSSINAKAFTHGNDIYFNQSQFTPETSEGQRLVAHELTHVVQGGERVCRKSGNEEGWKYIKEPDWITGKVLTYSAQKKLWENYKDKSKKKTITVVLYTNHLDACHGEYKKSCAFEERTHMKDEIEEKTKYQKPIPDYSDNGLSALITSEENTSVYFIQGFHNPTSTLENLVKTYGYLQNLIIAGHGNYNRILLNSHFRLVVGDDEFSTFFETVKELFKDTDKKTGKTKHSILLAGCLTGANPTLGIANSVKCIMEPLDVKVIANRAAVASLHYKYVYENDYLVFENKKDHASPTEQTTCVDSSSSAITSSTGHYTGNEPNGILMDVMRRINAGEPVNLSDYNMCTTNYSYYRNQNDCGGRWFSVKNKQIKVWYESQTLFDFIRKHYNSSGNNNKLLSFLTYLYNEKLPDNIPLITPSQYNNTIVNIDNEGELEADVSFFEHFYDNFHGTECIPFW